MPASGLFCLPVAVCPRCRAAPGPAQLGIDDAYLSPLRKVEPGSVKHVALVEVVQHGYKRYAMEVDRRDKESRTSQAS